MEEKRRLTFRMADYDDLRGIAACHRAAFPNSLASRLGETYVTKMYEWFLVNKYTFLACLTEGRECVAFMSGLIRDGSIRVGSASGMTQYSFSAAVRAFLLRPWLLFHPDFLSRYSFIVRNIRMKVRGTKMKPTIATASGDKSASLVAIAVVPAMQSKGYGSRLLEEFEKLARARGCTFMLLSVKSDNATAIKSYKRNGWTIKQESGKNLEMIKGL